uniref:Uncharacterized protein n=1 Tax=viral metagenome TaxID=1070528 RepID=A0A6C0H8T5_9ZZZZ
MEKKICFLHVCTNNDTYINEFKPVSKKKLHCYEKLVLLNYEIGFYKNNNYIKEKEKTYISLPNYFIVDDKYKDLYVKNTSTPIEIILDKLSKDLLNVDIIICYNTIHTINTLIAEAMRYHVPYDFQKYIIIDIKEECTNCDSVRNNFFKIYNSY